MSNWRKELYDKVGNDDIQRSDVETFMADKFEELIEEIPSKAVHGPKLKRIIRAKWLGKE
jgi:hypothetical protein